MARRESAINKSDMFETMINIKPISYLEYFFTKRVDVLCQDRERPCYAKNGEGLDREPVQLVNGNTVW